MNITLQVMLYPANHDLSYNLEKQAVRYRRGDIVKVYLTSEIVEPPTIGTRMAFIHITGVPDVAPFEDIKNILTRSIHNEVYLNRPVLRRRAWRLPNANLPQAIKNQLIATQEITVTWTQAKPYIRKKAIVNALDVLQDNEATEITDTDIAA